MCCCRCPYCICCANWLEKMAEKSSEAELRSKLIEALPATNSGTKDVAPSQDEAEFIPTRQSNQEIISLSGLTLQLFRVHIFCQKRHMYTHMLGGGCSLCKLLLYQIQACIPRATDAPSCEDQASCKSRQRFVAVQVHEQRAQHS